MKLPVPTVAHLKLLSSHLKSNTIIVGDIHGCLVEFKELLNKCKYNSADSTVVLVGDLVNKGLYSAEVIQFARSINAFAVRGNHDEAFLEYALNIKQNPPAHYDYINKLSSEDIEWMKELPYTISMPSLDSLVVHAGVVPNKNIEEQSFKDMILMRNVVNNNGVFEGYSGTDLGIPWVNEWKSKPHVYFGHDAKRGLQMTEFATGLDSGCVYGRKLSAIILPSKELVQVQAHDFYDPRGKDHND